MSSKIDLINSALVLIGDKPLNSLTEDRRAAVVALALYDDVFEGELNKHRWGFARKIEPLNQLAQEPPLPEFRYAYQLPTDLLVAVRLIPNEYKYKRYGYQIYSNQPQVSLDYIRKVSEAELPSYFVRLLTYALARDFATSIRDELNHFQAMDIRYKEEGRNARFQDSQEFPQDAIQDAPFVMPRF
jgi:hypothetical protein